MKNHSRASLNWPRLFAAVTLLIALVGAGTALAFDSGEKASKHPGDNTITWTGQGADDDGVLDDFECQPDGELPEGTCAGVRDSDTRGLVLKL